MVHIFHSSIEASLIQNKAELMESNFQQLHIQAHQVVEVTRYESRSGLQVEVQ